MSTQVIKAGLLSLIVCTDETDEAAELAANQAAPTGISSGWKLAEDKPGNPAQLPCASLVGHRHLRLEC